MQSLEIGGERGCQKSRPCIGFHGILERISSPGEGGAALSEAPGSKAFGYKCSRLGNLEALVCWNGRDVVGATELRLVLEPVALSSGLLEVIRMEGAPWDRCESTIQDIERN